MNGETTNIYNHVTLDAKVLTPKAGDIVFVSMPNRLFEQVDGDDPGGAYGFVQTIQRTIGPGVKVIVLADGIEVDVVRPTPVPASLQRCGYVDRDLATNDPVECSLERGHGGQHVLAYSTPPARMIPDGGGE